MKAKHNKKIKRPRLKPMYDLGIQKIQIPQPGNSSDVGGSVIGGTMAGAQMGMEVDTAMGGADLGAGTAIGAGAGLLYGLYNGLDNFQSNNSAARQAQAQNTAVDRLNKAQGATEHYQGDLYRNKYMAKDGVSLSKKMEIEIEGNETVFNKTPQGKFILKKVAKGPSHEGGGITYNASEGDIIFPKTLSSLALNAYKQGNFPRLESMRRKLPSEPTSYRESTFQEEYKNGSSGIPLPMYAGGYKGTGPEDYNSWNNRNQVSTPGNEQYYDPSFIAPSNIPPSNIPQLYQENYNLTQDRTGPGYVIQPGQQDNSKTPGLGFDFGNFNLPNLSGAGGVGKGILDFGLTNAASLYNLSRGLTDKPEVVQPHYINPVKYAYQDQSNPNRKASNSLERIQMGNARNAAGGNIQNYTANANQALSANFGRQEDINNYEAGRRDNVYNMNQQTQNQVMGYNAQEAGRVDERNAANRGAQRNLIGSGLEGLSQGYQMNKLNTNRNKRDQMIMNLMRTKNYTYDQASEALKYIQ